MRAIAVDWSGATHTARSHIWLAEAVSPGELVRLEAGRDRDALCNHLLSLGSAATVIGLDFAFSFPVWFLHQLGIRAAPALWEHVAQCGEAWLAACEPPFWGRPGRPRPPQDQPALRRTDRAVPKTGGIAPKSIFQIGGAGAVGTGSIRGMPLLHRFQAAGMRIWPFTNLGSPTVLEIYPRLMTGAVRKSDPAARAQLLASRYLNLRTEHVQLATASEDAFDAAVSALVMVEHFSELEALPPERDSGLRLEGRIWHPRWREDVL
jgi:Protein of unknown function (DUF429)